MDINTDFDALANYGLAGMRRHRIEILWNHDIKDPDKISHLARLSKKVVHQYIDLLPAKFSQRGPSGKNSFSKNMDA
jgi:uncharacterized protein YutE (UPF0331/DUF86 family)